MEELKKNKLKELIKNKYFKFGFWTFVFLLFVLWIGSFWLLLVIPIIFDFYVSNKVNWTFWKKRNLEKKSKVVEWIDALVFAVIAASIIRMFFIEAFTIPTSSMEKDLLVGDYLFVSKVSYGPRMPNTPLSFPFAHHTLPLTENTKSFLTWIEMPYHRLAGLEKIKNDDVVVFNFPEGDTVCVEDQNSSYYSIIRQKADQLRQQDLYQKSDKNFKIKSDNYYYSEAREMVLKNYTITVRPVDKQENYIKRCVGIHGDSLQVKHGVVFINGKQQRDLVNMQYKYSLKTKDKGLNIKVLEDMGVSQEDLRGARVSETEYFLPLTAKMVEELKNNPAVLELKRWEAPLGEGASYIFPFDRRYKWNEDNFGPLYIPEKGKTIHLDTLNLPLYQRAVQIYEQNKLEVKNGKIFINGTQADSYTFKMDYYFMMGDSRHNSADSRFWGFVPEDHVVGKALFVWWSVSPDYGMFDGGLRWSRIFNSIH
jgi:signal peptidase I